MFRTTLVSALLVTLLAFLAASPVVATTPTLAVDVPTSVEGTPLEFEVTLARAERGLKAQVLLDGKEIDTVSVRKGTRTLSFEGVALSPGKHRLEIRSASLSTEAEFRVIAGWLSLMPPLLAIALALVFKDVLIALFLGIFGGAMILFSWNPFAAFGRTIDHFVVPALADSDHASILIFTTLLGGMVGLITKSGGTHGIVEYLAPYATTPRRGQLATWMMGFMVFFDDYANTLIVGPTMRPITDKLRISREKLAYLVDSTAAPVVCLFPISTWVGFEIGLIGEAFDQLGLPYDAYSTFVSTIPYRLYPFFALVLVFTIAWFKFDFGPMRKAEKRARETGLLMAKDAKPIADYSSHEVEPAKDIAKRAINAVVPIATVVVVTLIGLYVTGSDGLTRAADDSLPTWIRKVLENANSYNALLWSSLSGVVMALILPLAQGLLKVRDGMAAMVAGFKAMLMALTVLILAWALSAVCGELRTAQYLVGMAEGTVNPMWLPTLTFLLAAAIAFATGSSWGTMAILEPLIIPICHTLAIEAGNTVGSETYTTLLLASIASVLTGSVWGDHCSPISDTTILSSMATGCDHIAHVRTQIPYAMFAGGLAIGIGIIQVIVGLKAWIALLGGIGIILGVVILGKRRQMRTDQAAA